MANITNYLNKIKTAVYGKDVRGAIHDAIKQVYDDASVNHDNANMEVKMARGTHNTLNDRLDNVDEIQAQTNAQLSHKVNKSEVFLKENGININDFDEDTRRTFLESQGIDVNYVLGDNNVLRNNIDFDSVFNQYPYHVRAKNPIKAIVDVKITNADENKLYYISKIGRNVGGVYNVTVSSYKNGVIAPEFSISKHNYTEPNGIDLFEVDYCKCWINWSMLREGVWNQNITFDQTQLDSACIFYKKSIGVESVDPKIISKLPFQRDAVGRYIDAIGGAKVIGANDFDKVYISKLYCDSDKTYIIELSRNNTVIARWQKYGYTPTDDIEKILLDEHNGSGVNATLLVDWTKLPSIVNLQNQNYSNYGLDYTSLVSKTGNDEQTYPFDSEASNVTLKKAIKNIKLYGCSDGEDYYISKIQRNLGDNHIYAITISKYNKDTGKSSECCGWSKWNFIESSVGRIELSEFYDSGITGWVEIDWSQISTNTVIQNIQHPTTKLHPLTLNIDNVEIVLPKNLYCVVGHELNIYIDNITKCLSEDHDVNFEYSGTGAKQYLKYLSINPPTSGEFTLKCVISKQGKLVRKAITTVKVVSEETSKNLTGIYIGDSNTASGHYVKEINHLFANDSSSSIVTIGTLGDDGANHEGRGGWSTTTYLTKENSNNRNNAFWDGNKFNFKYYMDTTGFQTPTFVAIQLGTNDAFGLTTEEFITNLKTMISSIHSYDSNIKVYLSLTMPPCGTQDGFGKLNGVQFKRLWHKEKTFDFVKAMIQEFDNENSNIAVIPIYATLDTINNFPYEEVSASNRLSRSYNRISDNLHPTKEGMYQIADVHYYFLKCQ